MLDLRTPRLSMVTASQILLAKSCHHLSLSRICLVYMVDPNLVIPHSQKLRNLPFFLDYLTLDKSLRISWSNFRIRNHLLEHNQTQVEVPSVLIFFVCGGTPNRMDLA